MFSVWRLFMLCAMFLAVGCGSIVDLVQQNIEPNPVVMHGETGLESFYFDANGYYTVTGDGSIMVTVYSNRGDCALSDNTILYVDATEMGGGLVEGWIDGTCTLNLTVNAKSDWRLIFTKGN